MKMLLVVSVSLASFLLIGMQSADAYGGGSSSLNCYSAVESGGKWSVIYCGTCTRVYKKKSYIGTGTCTPS